MQAPTLSILARTVRTGMVTGPWGPPLRPHLSQWGPDLQKEDGWLDQYFFAVVGASLVGEP